MSATELPRGLYVQYHLKGVSAESEVLAAIPDDPAGRRTGRYSL